MSRSPQVVTSRSGAVASAGPTTSDSELREDAPNQCHAPDTLHDTLTSHDDMIWSPNIPSYRREHVQLIPHSSSSSSSVSTSSQRHSKNKFKTKGFGFTQMAEPYDKALEVPSFRSVELRPSAGPRTASSPAVLSGRPLSLSELILPRDDEQSDESHLQEDDGGEYLKDSRRGEQAESHVENHPEFHVESALPSQNCLPGPPRLRNRSYSSPAEYPQIPLSSFTEIWR